MRWGIEPAEYSSGAWASRTLDRALWQSSALGLAWWQLAVGIFVVQRGTSADFELLVLHVFVALSALPAAAWGRHQLIRASWFSAMLGVLTADLALTSDDPATTVVCMTFVVVVTPILVMPLRLALVVTLGAVAAAVTVSLVARSSSRIAEAISVPALCYAIAATGLIIGLRRFAASVDQAASAFAADLDKLAASRASALIAAEYARTLHDTAINTLAAIATGGRATADAGRVRRRCADDVALIRALGTGHAPAHDASGIDAGLALKVRWTGLPEPARDAQIEELGSERSNALLSIVRELLINVEKHAGIEDVVIDASRHGDSLTITVTDTGRGFDFAPESGRGLAESVLGRASDAGIEVAVTSTPFKGTQVRLTCSLGREAGSSLTEDDTATDAAHLRRVGTWGWCIAVTAASLVSAAVGTGTLATYLSVGFVAGPCLAAWLACRRNDGELPGRVGSLIAATTPVAFVLAFVGANFGAGDPAFWQAIGLTPLLVVLLNTSPSRTPLVTASAGLGLSAAACAVVTWGSDASLISLANGSIQLAQLSIWVIFARVLDSIAAHAAEARYRARRVHTERAAVRSATTTQELWREAQLQEALSVLAEIADGRLQASEAEAQVRAGREEHLLRQTLMLTPSLVHLGPWLARAIGQSRRQNIRASIRTGNQDLPDAETAQAAGIVITKLLDTIPSGTDIVIAYFGGSSSPGLTVVGPTGFSVGLEDTAPGSACRVRRQNLGAQELLEIVPLQSP